MDIIPFPRALSQCEFGFNESTAIPPVFEKRKRPSPIRRQFTVALPWPPKKEEQQKQKFLPDINPTVQHSEKNKKLDFLLSKQRTGIDVPVTATKKHRSPKSMTSLYGLKADSNDVTAITRTFQPLNDKKNLNTSIDRLEFKAIQRNDGTHIKGEARPDQAIHTLIPTERRGPLNHNTGKHFRVVTILYNTMASLKLDNRQELASNDHARHHNKRQQQWIRSEQVKNWRRSTVNRVSKKTGYTSGSSSGQKSDVISGNSDDTIHTTSSNEESNNVFEYPMDAEKKESFDKCLKWMETLPQKFSGMHIFTPCVSD